METFKSIPPGLIYYCVLCNKVFLDNKICPDCKIQIKEIGWLE
jgi:hypothetical protein